MAATVVVPDSDAEMRVAWAARTCYGRLLALLASRTGDIGTAEDALSDAFERALTTWSRDGIPDNPDGWLLTVARNRLRDHQKLAATRTSVPLDTDRHAPAHLDEVDPDAVGDRRLELMLVCAHPAIKQNVRAGLMLNTVLGFTAAQIAEAFALPVRTLAARLVRAKRRIVEAGVPFAIPDRTVLPDRLGDLLEAVYGVYAIEWEIGGVEERASLASEALYLAELLARLAPDDAETHGLAALLSFSAARAPARLDASGDLVPLAEQQTARWDADLIARGRDRLRSAYARASLGRFQLEAAIQAVHCARLESGTTDWATLRDLYTHLNTLYPSLGAATALAAVTAEADSPEAGLAVLDDIGDRVSRFQPAWAARANLLERLGREDEARTAYDKAVSLSTSPIERAHLEKRRGGLAADR